MAENTPVPLNRIERTLAFMIAGVAGISVLAIIVIFVARLSQPNLDQGPWLTVALLPSIGLPVALGLIVAFAVVATVRRRRIARDGGH